MNLASRRSFRSVRSTAARPEPLLDSLEPRRLLATDLAAQITDFTTLPYLAPGDIISVPYAVRNDSPDRFSGNVRVRIFASTSPNGSNPVQLAETIRRGVSIAPGSQLGGTQSITLVNQLRPDVGNYFFFANVTPVDNANAPLTGAAADEFAGNDTAATVRPYPVNWVFGSFRGRTISFNGRDADGTLYFMRMTGPGFGQIDPAGNPLAGNGPTRDRIELIGTTAASSVTVTVSGRAVSTANLFADINADIVTDIDPGTNLGQNLFRFSAPTTNFSGSITVNNYLGGIALRNITQAEFNLGTQSAPVRGAPFLLTAAAVTDSSLTTGYTVGSIDVASWTGDSQVFAPQVNAFNVAGAFGGSLFVGPGGNSASALGSARFGTLSSTAAIAVFGNVGGVTASRSDAGAFIFVSGTLGPTTVSDLRGLRAWAASIRSLSATVTANNANLEVLAGARFGASSLASANGDITQITPTWRSGAIDSININLGSAVTGFVGRVAAGIDGTAAGNRTGDLLNLSTTTARVSSDTSSFIRAFNVRGSTQQLANTFVAARTFAATGIFSSLVVIPSTGPTGSSNIFRLV